MNGITATEYKELVMSSGDFNDWGPKRLDEHNTRLVELEAEKRTMLYRIEQVEANHKETMRTINEFVGETRNSFSNVQDDLHKRLGGLYEKLNTMQNLISQGQGAAAVIRVVTPLAAAAAGGFIVHFLGRL